MQELIDDASNSLDRAIVSLNLGVGVATLGINIRIDENVSALVSSVDEIKVDLSKLASQMGRMMKYINVPSRLSRTLSTFKSNTDIDGDGPGLDEMLLSKAPEELKKYDVAPTSLERVKVRPIGRGASAKVFLVRYGGQLRAAKVVSLVDVPSDMLQDLYVKFTWELYVLTMLKHPRVVEVCGSVTSISEYTLILEYMENGSLRNVLDHEDKWSKITPQNRFQILVDIAEGMAYLHQMRMHHRDLKSPNILLDGDFRAKISDFGLTKTATSLSTYSKSNKNAMSRSGTLAWQPPEIFVPKKSGMRNSGEKMDCYAYGIIAWEVLSGFAGSKYSIPWKGNAESQIIQRVLSGDRPSLPCGWDSSNNISMHERVKEIMIKCLSGDPNHRPSFQRTYELLMEKERFESKSPSKIVRASV